MTSRACNQENCTVGETGVCLLNNPPDECPNRLAQDADNGNSAAEPPLIEPETYPRFPSSLTLTKDLTRDLMAARYCRLVGILGLPDAGKTAALVSLYLLLSKGKLEGFSFLDSRTLMALDDISQGARRWNSGQYPEQMTSHTELGEGRSAGFLHIKLRRTADKRTADLLLPDLPGEWSTSLIDSSRIDRLEFLRRADVIWIMVDGGDLAAAQTRLVAVHRTKMLIQRIAQYFSPPPPVILVITRRDKGQPTEAAISSIFAEAAQRGVALSVAPIASFSEVDEVPAGTGIPELISLTIGEESQEAVFWPDTDLQSPDRSILRYRERPDHD